MFVLFHSASFVPELGDRYSGSLGKQQPQQQNGGLNRRPEELPPWHTKGQTKENGLWFKLYDSAKNREKLSLVSGHF